MKVLSIFNEESSNRARSAYIHRLEKLRGALDARGVSTEMIGLREQRVENLVQVFERMPAGRIRVKIIGFSPRTGSIRSDNALSLVESRYDWGVRAQQMLAAYDKLRQAASGPDRSFARAGMSEDLRR